MIRWFTQDWGLKVISLFLAVGLWYYAVGEEGIEVTRRVPLEIRLENEQMSILKTSVSQVNVLLMAPRAALSELASGEIRAVHTIGAEMKSAGDYSFRLEPREIKLPLPYIRVAKIEPEIIRVSLDELIVKKVEVKPNFAGEPAFGYTLKEDEIQLNPNAVLIEGPRAQLEQMDIVLTERIDLVGRIRSFRRTAALFLGSNVKSLNESLIDVFIPIKEEFDEKSFEEIPVKVIKSSDAKIAVRLNPAAISFVLKGSRRQLEKLLPEKILAFLDTSAFEPGEYEVPVELVLPEDVSLKDDASVMVRVKVKKI